MYALLPSEHALDYDVLKGYLLRRFDKTEDGFKQKFRACRPESGETLTNPNLRGSHKNDRNGEDKGFKAKLRYQEMLQMWGSRSYKYKLIRVSMARGITRVQQ